jgi:hypothetical protein
MSKLLKAAGIAALMSLGGTVAMAQSNQGQGQSQTNTQAAPKDDQTNPSGTTSRAMTGNEPSTDKTKKKDGTPDLKKLDSQGRGGQQN